MAAVLFSQQPLNEASTMKRASATSNCYDGAFLKCLGAYGADTCRWQDVFLRAGRRYDRRPLRG
eukprot:1738375-Lingulodinium_polyedra.AAC.1